MLTGLLDRISKTLQLPVAPSAPPVFAESFDPATYTRENARQIFPKPARIELFHGGLRRRLSNAHRVGTGREWCNLDHFR